MIAKMPYPGVCLVPGVTLAIVLALPFPAISAAPFQSDRISVTMQGQGRDVVLVPGLGSSPKIWSELTDEQPGIRFHLVHVSGFAGQPAGANDDGPVLAPVAEEIARYLEEEGLKDPVLVGHSLGGALGIMVAARHPDAVDGLMLLDIPPFLGAIFAGPDATADDVSTIADGLRSKLQSSEPDEWAQFWTQEVEKMVATPTHRPMVLEGFISSDQAVVGQAMYEGIATDLSSDLKKITVPAEVIYVAPEGMPPEQIDAFYQGAYAGLDQGTFTRIEDSAHFIMLDQPGRLAEEFTEFLATLN